LVLQGQHLEEQAPAGFQSGNGQVKREVQPTNHAAEDSGKYRRSPVFSPQMRFLLVTAVEVAHSHLASEELKGVSPSLPFTRINLFASITFCGQPTADLGRSFRAVPDKYPR
jgi:hypothetical protein